MSRTINTKVINHDQPHFPKKEEIRHAPLAIIPAVVAVSCIMIKTTKTSDQARHGTETKWKNRKRRRRVSGRAIFGFGIAERGRWVKCGLNRMGD